ncbi:hypothetical protein SKAU_G00143520 [Synaphobranchus kaupii]|uniref:Uncharacterized protein n=1 Tax=Synaphobranchus kaupii TaxID=118154 RepID=A0A9Q1FTC6_SYNKA|nr:hypothetical protein SKAU_G00143520 [Synaphobranchus kaupii]
MMFQDSSVKFQLCFHLQDIYGHDPEAAARPPAEKFATADAQVRHPDVLTEENEQGGGRTSGERYDKRPDGIECMNKTTLYGKADLLLPSLLRLPLKRAASRPKKVHARNISASSPVSDPHSLCDSPPDIRLLSSSTACDACGLYSATDSSRQSRPLFVNRGVDSPIRQQVIYHRRAGRRRTPLSAN